MRIVAAAWLAVTAASAAELRFPSGDFLYPPTCDGGLCEKAIIDESELEKVRDLSPRDADRELAEMIGHLRINAPGWSGVCSGSLVGPDLFLTNQHCAVSDFGDPLPPPHFTVHFDYLEDETLGAGISVVEVIIVHEGYDYALLRLQEPEGEARGWLTLADRSLGPVSNVKIIQHPAGRPKEIARRESHILGSSNEEVLHYIADTERGSSGSPVFALGGTEIVALHHAYQGGARANEGIRSWRVAEGIAPYLPQAAPANAAPADDDRQCVGEEKCFDWRNQ